MATDTPANRIPRDGMVDPPKDSAADEFSPPVFMGSSASNIRTETTMRHRPTFAEFADLARGASLVPVYRQLVGDTLTPVSAFCKVLEEGPAFLFESVVGGERLGRYSFLGAGPFLQLQARDRTVTIDDGRSVTTSEPPDPLRLLEELLAKSRAPHVRGLPRFCGGAVGSAGYDTVRYVERLPHPPADDRGLP